MIHHVSINAKGHQKIKEISFRLRCRWVVINEDGLHDEAGGLGMQRQANEGLLRTSGWRWVF